MADDPYSLAELARLADVTPRTIRYYVAQGLLPSPEAAGPSTRYGEGHLLRLRLIKRLQRDHLPLAEIRGRVERMEDEEVAQVLNEGQLQTPPPARAETLNFVRGLISESRARRVSEYHPMTPDAYPLPSEPPPLREAPMPALRMSIPMAPGSRPTTGDRSTWERLAITADVELHVRRPLDRQSNKKVEQLARIARELFEEEP